MECLVIGGGPAGLTAAIYLARFRRDFIVIDGGASRADWIPLSHNHAGFPDGIGGPDLIARMRAQARRYGARIVRGEVGSLDLLDDGSFSATVGTETIRAQKVLLATGVVDIEPELPNLADAVRSGLIRHCPICDAYEVIDRKVAIIGYADPCVGEALLLRAYTADLTLLTLGRTVHLSHDERKALATCGIRVVEEPVSEIICEGGRIAAWRMGSGDELRFDTIYSALGRRVRSDLAVALGAACDEDGAVIADEHQRTSVPGLYAAGDVVRGLAQISVASGQAAVAATDINNSLGRIRPCWGVDPALAGRPR